MPVIPNSIKTLSVKPTPQSRTPTYNHIVVDKLSDGSVQLQWKMQEGLRFAKIIGEGEVLNPYVWMAFYDTYESALNAPPLDGNATGISYQCQFNANVTWTSVENSGDTFTGVIPEIWDSIGNDCYSLQNLCGLRSTRPEFKYFRFHLFEGPSSSTSCVSSMPECQCDDYYRTLHCNYCRSDVILFDDWCNVESGDPTQPNITPAPSTPTKTPAPTATPTKTPAPTATKTPAPTATPTKTATPTPTKTLNATPGPTATPTPTKTPTATPGPTGTVTPTPGPTATPGPTGTVTPTPGPTATATTEVPKTKIRFYTMELVLKVFVDPTVTFGKLVDFNDLSKDTGLYLYNGIGNRNVDPSTCMPIRALGQYLQFIPKAGPGNTAMSQDGYNQIVLKREETEKVTVYLNKVKQFEFYDYENFAVIDSGSLWFFKDDNITNNEEFKYRVSKIVIYPEPLSESEILELPVFHGVTSDCVIGTPEPTASPLPTPTPEVCVVDLSDVPENLYAFKDCPNPEDYCYTTSFIAQSTSVYSTSYSKECYSTSPGIGYRTECFSTSFSTSCFCTSTSTSTSTSSARSFIDMIDFIP